MHLTTQRCDYLTSPRLFTTYAPRESHLGSRPKTLIRETRHHLRKPGTGEFVWGERVVGEEHKQSWFNRFKSYRTEDVRNDMCKQKFSLVSPLPPNSEPLTRQERVARSDHQLLRMAAFPGGDAVPRITHESRVLSGFVADHERLAVKENRRREAEIIQAQCPGEVGPAAGTLIPLFFRGKRSNELEALVKFCRSQKHECHRVSCSGPPRSTHPGRACRRCAGSWGLTLPWSRCRRAFCQTGRGE